MRIASVSLSSSVVDDTGIFSVSMDREGGKFGSMASWPHSSSASFVVKEKSFRAAVVRFSQSGSPVMDRNWYWW